MQRRRLLGLVLGPLLFVLLLALPAPAGMSTVAMKVAATTLLMAVWWISEAIPIAATALLPIALFPILNIMSSAQTTAAYANHLIYLFMGGFLIAVTMEKWQLHKRLALHTILLVGTAPDRIVLGFMLATAFLSMWVSNTATAMMMLTIGLAVIKQHSPATDDGAPTAGTPFATALMLGIAYSASIGGVATLIGTPPNAILAGIAEKNYGITIGFARWLAFALPLSLLMLLCTWVYLTRILFRLPAQAPATGRAGIRDELLALGRMRREEKAVLAVFCAVAAAWILRGLIDSKTFAQITDSTIAMSGALLLFVIPADFKRGEFLLDWRTAVTIPWDVIVLFGGGFALADAFAGSGLSQWLAQELSVLQGAGSVVMVVASILLVIFLTEVTSNTATASLMIPLMGAVAQAMQMHPLTTMTAVAIAASYAFMLPVATPPNAIVYSSRCVSLPQMARAGFALNLLGTALIALFILLVLPRILP